VLIFREHYQQFLLVTGGPLPATFLERQRREERYGIFRMFFTLQGRNLILLYYRDSFFFALELDCSDEG
jgi:hypothetical protein